MSPLNNDPKGTCRLDRSRGWHMLMPGRVSVVAVISLLALALLYPVQAAMFHCDGGDVSCLIDAIQVANANGGANMITLAEGTYRLTTRDHLPEGVPGLPAITSPLTIRGAGAGRTILERELQAPGFPLIHVAASGTLTLEGLTLQGEPELPGGRGLIHMGGTVILTRSSLEGTRTSVDGGLPLPERMPSNRPRIIETDLIPMPGLTSPPQSLDAYLTLVQTALKQEVAMIPQTGLVEVTLAIRRDGSVRHTQVVPLEGPASLRSQLAPYINRLGPLPPLPVEVDLLVVTVLLSGQYPGADLLDRFGPQP